MACNRDPEDPSPNAQRDTTPEGARTEPPTDAPRTAEEDAGTPRPTLLPRTLHARELLGDERVLHIEHEGEIYTLRLTRNDRLILTK